MQARRIAVIGFGFSGGMVTANLVKKLAAGDTLYIIADDLNAEGLAYGTTNPNHLLNVPAARMSAWPDVPDDLLQWLKTPEAARAKQRLKVTREYSETDFIPRALYAAYIQHIWQQTQTTATERGCLIKLVETTATRIRTEGELAVLTARGDAIAVDDIVLACGNEIKHILPQIASPNIIQNPWAKQTWEDAANWASPVMLYGAGLTAVDTVLSLRSAGYKGTIIAASRGGKWPAAHQPTSNAFQFDKEELFAQQTLQQLVRLLRQKITAHGQWRPVIDALRPHTPGLWKRLSARDQKRFLSRLLSLWNVHRHRMAPEIAARIEQETQAGTLQLIASHTIHATLEENILKVTLHTAAGTQHYTPSRIINCSGGELNFARAANPLLKQAMADHVLEPHASNVGLTVDPRYRAWGAAHPHLYVIGSWMTGQWLESTAVPELRVQARNIAESLTSAE